jgi:hypothetical protein
MPESKPTVRFEILCQAYLEDALAPEEAVELKSLLEKNPDWAKHLLADVKMACLVSEVVREEHEADASASVPDVIAQIAGATGQRSRVRPTSRRSQKRSSFVPIFALAACFVAFIGGVIWMSQVAEPVGGAMVVARIEANSGVRIVRDGQDVSISGETDLLAGDIVVAGSGRAVIRYRNEETTVSLYPESHLHVDDVDGAKTLKLDFGRMHAVVAKQPTGKPMICRTPHAVATVLGTAFELRSSSFDARLDVSEGRVRYENKSGASVVVETGYYAIAVDGKQLVSKPLKEAPSQPTVAKPDGLPKVIAFYLVHGNSPKDVSGLTPISDGAVIDLSKLPSPDINIVATSEPRVLSYMKWTLHDGSGNAVRGVTQAREKFEPYSMAGDDFPWPDKKKMYHTWRPKPGRYTATATAFGQNDKPGPTRTLTFTIVDSK